MKQKLIFLLAFIAFFTFPLSASAHLAGQPSFFKMDGVLTNLYPVQATSISTFVMPQDSSPATYLVNVPIHLELVTSLIQIPQEIIQKTKFYWDFGDGQKAVGLVFDHTYKKMGSYVINIYAQTPDLPDKQLIQSVLLNVLPNSSYKLPQSVILLNGMKSKNPLTDILYVDYSYPLTYDGSESKVGTAKIVSYYWDLGDEVSSNKITTTHRVSAKYYLAFPVLRVIDANGFISDSTVQINNKKGVGIFHPSETKKTSQAPKGTSNPILFFIIGAAIFIIVIIFFIFTRKRK